MPGCAPDPHHAPYGWAEAARFPGLHHYGGVLHHGPLLFGGLDPPHVQHRLCVAVGAVLFGGAVLRRRPDGQLWQLYLFYGYLSGLGWASSIPA